ncbi:MAG: GNAT family N-acetyltransferase [Saprospiraceae bacterium]|jgi:GNAT superfamily N-acetyltransferase
MSEITLAEVNNKKLLRCFIHLPGRVHLADPNWLPPLYMDEWDFFNPKKNKAFAYCDTLLLLAYRAGKPVGRIMGIIHHPYNARKGEHTVRFSHFECMEDEAAATALLEAIADWGRGRGMSDMVGPFGFSDKDPEGLMVEGFGTLPLLVTATNRPYLPAFVERAGFRKKTDCLDFVIDLERDIPAIFPRVYERISQNPMFRLLEFRKTRELKPWIPQVFRLVNTTYTELYGFQPMGEEEIKALTDRYLPLLDPNFVKIVVDQAGKVAGFVAGIPNMSPGIQRSKGYLFPLGIFHILHAARRTRQLDLMLGAVAQEHRGRGLDVLMGWPLIQSARRAGIQTFETHLVLEQNERMLAEYARLGARLNKRFRIYQRDL